MRRAVARRRAVGLCSRLDGYRACAVSFNNELQLTRPVELPLLALLWHVVDFNGGGRASQLSSCSVR
jgi:hypothetical protein